MPMKLKPILTLIKHYQSAVKSLNRSLELN
jgi:hypothetical protein